MRTMKTFQQPKPPSTKATPEDIRVLRGLCDDEHIIRWARKTDRGVVVKLIEALYKKQGGAVHYEAARGLQGRDLEDLQKAMGTFRAATPDGPYETNDGRRLVFPASMTAETRARLANEQNAKHLAPPRPGLSADGRRLVFDRRSSPADSRSAADRFARR